MNTHDPIPKGKVMKTHKPITKDFHITNYNEVCEIVKHTDTMMYSSCNVYGCNAAPKYVLRIGGGNMVTVISLCRRHKLHLIETCSR
jgi:hypothetical protein